MWLLRRRLRPLPQPRARLPRSLPTTRTQTPTRKEEVDEHLPSGRQLRLSVSLLPLWTGTLFQSRLRLPCELSRFSSKMNHGHST
jgi:hypothetical protein